MFQYFDNFFSQTIGLSPIPESKEDIEMLLDGNADNCSTGKVIIKIITQAEGGIIGCNFVGSFVSIENHN